MSKKNNKLQKKQEGLGNGKEAPKELPIIDVANNEGPNILEWSDNKLKVTAYDLIAEIEVLQSDLQKINAVIASRARERRNTIQQQTSETKNQ